MDFEQAKGAQRTMSDNHPKRIRDHEYYGGGILKLTDWPDLDAHQKICAEAFEEGLENTLNEFPPSLDVDPSEDRGDVELTVQLCAGEDDGGPTWQFSMRRAIASYAQHGETESIDELIKALGHVIKYARMVKQRLKALDGEDWRACGDLWRELDKEFPQEPDRTPAWAKEFAGELVSEFAEAMLESVAAQHEDAAMVRLGIAEIDDSGAVVARSTASKTSNPNRERSEP
jgi:hypothetical protein